MSLCGVVLKFGWVNLGNVYDFFGSCATSTAKAGYLVIDALVLRSYDAVFVVASEDPTLEFDFLL